MTSIMLASKRDALLRPIAKANKVKAGKQTGRGNEKVLAKMPEPFSTRREAAKAAGVGARTQATCSTKRPSKR